MKTLIYAGPVLVIEVAESLQKDHRLRIGCFSCEKGKAAIDKAQRLNGIFPIKSTIRLLSVPECAHCHDYARSYYAKTLGFHAPNLGKAGRYLKRFFEGPTMPLGHRDRAHVYAPLPRKGLNLRRQFWLTDSSVASLKPTEDMIAEEQAWFSNHYHAEIAAVKCNDLVTRSRIDWMVIVDREFQ